VATASKSLSLHVFSPSLPPSLAPSRSTTQTTLWAYSFSRDCSSGELGQGGPLFCDSPSLPPFPPSLQIDYPDDLWAYSFSRDCSSGELGQGGPLYCRTVNTRMINETEFLFVVERKYLELATKTGPSPREVMPPTVLIFDRVEEEEEEEEVEEVEEDELVWEEEEEKEMVSRPALRRRV